MKSVRCALAAVAALVAAANAGGAVLTVSQSGNDESPEANGYATLSAAIDAANDGDIVEISPSASPYVLSAEIEITKAIAVRGGGTDREAVLIESDGTAHRIFTISNKDAVLSGVTIQNVSSPGSNSKGGAIMLSAGTVTNCLLTKIYAKNGSNYGNGIWMANTADAVVTHCKFVDVSSERSCAAGCAIHSDGRNSIVRHCEIVDCCSYGNNGAWGGFVRGTTVSDSIVRSCQSSDRFYGIVRDANVYRCEIRDNPVSAGPVVYGCTVYDSLIADNAAPRSGYSEKYNIVDNSSILYNCTVAGNTINNDMFCLGSTTKIYNSIVWSNTNSLGDVKNYDSTLVTKAQFEYSCVMPVPDSGFGNTEDDPCLTGDCHLGNGSSAFNTGLASLRSDLTDASKDLAGNGRVLLGTIDRGCYEKTTLDHGQFSVSVSDVATVSCLTGAEQSPTALLVASAGDAFDIEWMWGDGNSTKIENFTATGGEETLTASHAYTIGGIMDLAVKVTNLSSHEERLVLVAEKYAVKSATPSIYYVSSVAGDNNNDGLSAAAPFATLNSALAAACDGSEIRLMAGGEHIIYEQRDVTNAVCIVGWSADGSVASAKEDVILQSDGRAHRILYVNNSGAVVRGLTITGARFTSDGCGVYLNAGRVEDCLIHNNAKSDGNVKGVGVYLANTVNAVLSGCVISNNYSALYWISGAGAYCPGKNARIENCVFVDNKPNGNNSAWGGVVCGATLRDCAIQANVNNGYNNTGNGVRDAALYRCRIVGNTGIGTVLSNCDVYDSIIAENSSSTTLIDTNTKLYGCTVVGNIVNGTETCLAGNTKSEGSIVWNNTNSEGTANYAEGASFNNSCVSPATSEGEGNVDADPKLDLRAKRMYQLTAKSPCLNRIAFTPTEERMTDITGKPRVVHKLMDMGCYEFQGDSPLVIIFR